MSPILFHIWGPFAVHWYGFCIMLGIITAGILLLRDQKIPSIISRETMINSLQLMIVAGYLGGRILCILTEPDCYHDYRLLFKFWEPGLSVSGAVIGIYIIVGIYLKLKNINILAYFDRLALYAPLVQSFGRLGCFFAGCCYGQPAQFWWSVTYTKVEQFAPLNIALHPTQLYSGLLLFLIFLFLYRYVQYNVKKIGCIFYIYLILIGIERFFIDFFRWDQAYYASPSFLQILSISQWASLLIINIGIVGIIKLTKNNRLHGSI